MKDMFEKPLTYILWKWNDDSYSVKYTAEHVNIMASMIARNTQAPHRIICITDDPAGILCETFPLWNDLKDLKDGSWPSIVRDKTITFPSCSRRLKIFSTDTTRALDIPDGEKVVSMDLDMVITDTLDPLFEVDTDFIGWHPGEGRDHTPPRFNAGYNGSVFMFRAGTCDFLWDDFDQATSPKKALEAGYYGDDQGWLSYKMYAHYPEWTINDGIRRYIKDLAQHGAHLPEGTRVAVFPGKWKPWHTEVTTASLWVTEHYKKTT
jgi:hypothetical protein